MTTAGQLGPEEDPGAVDFAIELWEAPGGCHGQAARAEPAAPSPSLPFRLIFSPIAKYGTYRAAIS